MRGFLQSEMQIIRVRRQIAYPRRGLLSTCCESFATAGQCQQAQLAGVDLCSHSQTRGAKGHYSAARRHAVSDFGYYLEGP